MGTVRSAGQGCHTEVGNQGLSTHECDGDVRMMWKLPVNSHFGWLHRWGHLNGERTLVEEDDSITGKGELASRPLLLQPQTGNVR